VRRAAAVEQQQEVMRVQCGAWPEPQASTWQWWPALWSSWVVGGADIPRDGAARRLWQTLSPGQPHVCTWHNLPGPGEAHRPQIHNCGASGLRLLAREQWERSSEHGRSL